MTEWKTANQILCDHVLFKLAAHYLKHFQVVFIFWHYPTNNLNQCSAEAVACFFVSSQLLCVSLASSYCNVPKRPAR